MGETALHKAAAEGRVEICAYLLSAADSSSAQDGCGGGLAVSETPTSPPQQARGKTNPGTWEQRATTGLWNQKYAPPQKTAKPPHQLRNTLPKKPPREDRASTKR
jgi:ankyrin repeat protein